jgi:hypothetical protein
MVLAAAVLVPAGAGGGGPDWKALERPLHLPALGPGGACPASALSSRVTRQTYGVGGLGAGGLVAYFRSDLGPWASWTGQAPGSSGRPSAVRVLVPGCYGVEIDGTSFSTLVVFPVSTAH